MKLNKIALMTCLVVSGIAVSSVLDSANAGVLFDSLNGKTGGSDALSNSYGTVASFSTGSIASNLTNITLGFYSNNFSNSTHGLLSLNLYSDSGSRTPSSLLINIATINNSSVPSSFGPVNYTYTLSNSYSLSANTRYWLELHDTDTSSLANNSISWEFTHDISGFGVANEYLGIITLSNGSSAIYPNQYPGNPSALSFQINATNNTSVPEPLNILGAAAGLVLFGTTSAVLKRKAK
jgi:hypothetical protein